MPKPTTPYNLSFVLVDFVPRLLIYTDDSHDGGSCKIEKEDLGEEGAQSI